MAWKHKQSAQPHSFLHSPLQDQVIKPDICHHQCHTFSLSFFLLFVSKPLVGKTTWISSCTNSQACAKKCPLHWSHQQLQVLQQEPCIMQEQIITNIQCQSTGREMGQSTIYLHMCDYEESPSAGTSLAVSIDQFSMVDACSCKTILLTIKSFLLRKLLTRYMMQFWRPNFAKDRRNGEIIFQKEAKAFKAFHPDRTFNASSFSVLFRSFLK